MKITETHLKGCFIIEPKVWEDHRGYMFEAFKKNVLEEALGYTLQFVQENESKSKKDVVRGLHIQRGEFSQSKLVRVIQGKILDVAVDVRKDSPTFGQFFTIELSQENKKQFFIPKGFLHGFSVLSEEATVLYKCDEYYHPETEDSCHPLDKNLAIDWQIDLDKAILSEKDQNAKAFESFQPY